MDLNIHATIKNNYIEIIQSSTMIFMIESLPWYHFHILVGIFIIELVLYIPMMGFLKIP